MSDSSASSPATTTTTALLRRRPAPLRLSSPAARQQWSPVPIHSSSQQQQQQHRDEHARFELEHEYEQLHEGSGYTYDDYEGAEDDEDDELHSFTSSSSNSPSRLVVASSQPAVASFAPVASAGSPTTTTAAASTTATATATPATSHVTSTRARRHVRKSAVRSPTTETLPELTTTPSPRKDQLFAASQQQQQDQQRRTPMAGKPRAPRERQGIKFDEGALQRKKAAATDGGIISDVKGGGGARAGGSKQATMHWRHASMTPQALAALERRKTLKRISNSTRIHCARATYPLLALTALSLALALFLWARAAMHNWLLEHDGLDLDDGLRAQHGASRLGVRRDGTFEPSQAARRHHHPQAHDTAAPATAPVDRRSLHDHSFRHQIEESERYLTTLSVEGTLSAQTKSLYRFLQLAGVLSRVPILPPLELKPNALDAHAHQQHEHVDTSSVYDLSRLGYHQRASPPLEWSALTAPQRDRAQLIDTLGCWADRENTLPPTKSPHSTASSAKAAADEVYHESIANRVASLTGNGVATSLFPLALTKRSILGEPPIHATDFAAFYERVLRFDLDTGAKRAIVAQTLHSDSATSLRGREHTPPEEHVFCLDPTLLMTSQRNLLNEASDGLPTFFEEDPAWNDVGRYLHFTSEMDSVASDYLSYLLQDSRQDSEDGGEYIAVHIDALVTTHCTTRAGDKCTPSLSAYVRAVDRMQSHLLKEAAVGARMHRRPIGGSRAHHRGRNNAAADVSDVVDGARRQRKVIVVTDVEDQKFRQEVHGLGWHMVEPRSGHARARYAEWSPDVIEAVLLSKAKAFVGTRNSEESELAGRRVLSWTEGHVAFV